MNWQTELAALEFGIRQIEGIPELAANALEEGLDTPSLRILAGLHKDNITEIKEYLKKSTDELKIEYPAREQSAWLLIRYFIDEIIESNIDPHEGIHTIIWQIYHSTDWNKKNKEYAGDSIGIQKLYGLCDTYDELSSSSKRWDQEKTNEELLEELSQQMIEASREYKNEYLAQQINRADRG